QLKYMTENGLLKGAPPLAQEPTAPQAFDVYKPNPDFKDKSETWIDNHARAYLDANCGYCHRPKGRAGYTGLILEDFFRAPQHKPDTNYYGICKGPTAYHHFPQSYINADIVPGMPEKSVLFYRIDNDYRT